MVRTAHASDRSGKAAALLKWWGGVLRCRHPGRAADAGPEEEEELAAAAGGGAAESWQRCRRRRCCCYP